MKIVHIAPLLPARTPRLTCRSGGYKNRISLLPLTLRAIYAISFSRDLVGEIISCTETGGGGEERGREANVSEQPLE